MSDTATCPKHHNIPLVCPACNGAKGGQSKSPRKRASSAANVAKALAARWARLPR